MPLAIQPAPPAIAPLGAEMDVALQPGTVVSAKVLQVIANDLVRIAIANLTLDVATAKPLQPGQTLQLAVAQTPTGLSLTPVTDDGPTSSRAPAAMVDDVPLAPRVRTELPQARVLTPQEARAVANAAQGAVTKQAGLSPLFANVSAAVESGQLSPQVLVAAKQLLDLRLLGTAELTGDDVRLALQSSGLTMEASRAVPSANPPPDIKSTLLVLRQALGVWADELPEIVTSPQSQIPVPAKTTSVLSETPELRSQPVRPMNAQVAAALQALGTSIESTQPVEASTNLLAAQLAATVSRPRIETQSPQMASPPPPPVRGAAPAAQSVAAPTLSPDAPPAIIARELIADTDGALARQTLLQIASLPDQADAQMPRNDALQPRWNFEIPFVTPQGTAMAQFEIARDGGGTETDPARRTWRARFSLDIEPAGPVHALIAFGGDHTSVKMWAERPATAAKLRANALQLGQSLDRAELKAGDIIVADGAPALPKVASGYFLNRAT